MFAQLPFIRLILKSMAQQRLIWALGVLTSSLTPATAFSVQAAARLADVCWGSAPLAHGMRRGCDSARCDGMKMKTSVDERSAGAIAEALERDPDVGRCTRALRRRRVDYRDGGLALQGLAVWPSAVGQHRTFAQ